MKEEMEKKQRDNRSYWSNQGTKILKRGKIIKMYQNLFPVKTVSFVNLPVFWENREMFLPFISA